MTLRELAEKAECSESMLSKVENGLALVSLTTLHKVYAVPRPASKHFEPPVIEAARKILLDAKAKIDRGDLIYRRVRLANR